MLGFLSPTRRALAKSEAEKRLAEFQKLPKIEQRTRLFRIAAGRETIEAFAVAFILALLFRVFLAEAFVIPTGSMAPTLMGAHKDVFCEACDYRFQLGASIERESTMPKRDVVVGGVCPNCRKLNSLDLANKEEHGTFNGDRIVVNRYSYAIGDPDRWDVIVFKFPGNPKQNYIKRLVGLPGEVLTLRHGDVYRTPMSAKTDPETILRKSPEKVQAMSHIVYDTAFQSPDIVASNYPSRWQPWQPGATEPPTDSWKVTRDNTGINATLDASVNSLDATGDASADGQTEGNREKWLRYFHRWPSETDWSAIRQGQPVDVDPYHSRAITDFYAYDSAIKVDSNRVYDVPPSDPSSRPRGRVGRTIDSIDRLIHGDATKGVFSPKYQSAGPVDQFGFAVHDQLESDDPESALNVRDGMHWVGDLSLTIHASFGEQAKSATMELVRAGVRYQARIDLSSGETALAILDGENEFPFDGPVQPSAATEIRSGGEHEIRMTNYDQQILLWVDGEAVDFDSPTTYSSADFRRIHQDRPHWTAQHPLDAAPAGIAVSGGSATIDHLLVERDQYYIATRLGSYQGNTDYQSVDNNTGRMVRPRDVQTWFGKREEWSEFDWTVRQSVSFELDEGQFFPMGDNSPGSLDARGWVGKARAMMPDNVIRDAWKWRDVNYVPRELMVGKAVAVFWPHSWNSPVPFTPNVSRMGLIR